jgi:hypothetical protein
VTDGDDILTPGRRYRVRSDLTRVESGIDEAALCELRGRIFTADSDVSLDEPTRTSFGARWRWRGAWVEEIDDLSCAGEEMMPTEEAGLM